MDKCNICILTGEKTLVKGVNNKYQRAGCPSYVRFIKSSRIFLLSLAISQAWSSSLHISWKTSEDKFNNKNNEAIIRNCNFLLFSKIVYIYIFFNPASVIIASSWYS